MLSTTPRILAGKRRAITKRFTKQHEWISIDDKQIGNPFPPQRNGLFTGQLGTVGITEYAAKMLGDVVYAEFPMVDDHVSQGGIIAGPNIA